MSPIESLVFRFCNFGTLRNVYLSTGALGDGDNGGASFALVKELIGPQK